MAAAQSPLCRWKRFFRTFDAIDAAVESSVPACHPDDELQCAMELRRVKGEIVELLCNASEDDAAEELCRVLDDVMAESLITLQSVPVTTSALASTDLAMAVGALEEHESARIGGLARDIVRRWRAPVESPAPVVGHARSFHVPVAADEQDEEKRQVKEASRPEAASGRVEPAKSSALAKRIPAVGAGRGNTANMEEMLPKKMPAAIGDGVWSDKMEATKRKLREGYREMEDAKRRRRIQVIEAPKMVE